MSCCGGGGWHNRPNRKFDCSAPPAPPKVMCCGKQGAVSIRLPNCPCCLPMCPPPEAPQCPRPCLCAPPPTCPGGGCPPPCDSCGGPAPCCPRPAPCKPKVVLTCERRCCPKQRRDITDCPDQVTWPAPPKIDMCCSTSCPPRSIDICYMKVCPSPPRCCPPNFPCGARASAGGTCCPGRNKY